MQVVVDVTDWSEPLRTRLLETIETLQADVPAPAVDEVEVESSGWTKELVEEALDRLARTGAVAQIKSIRRAIENGGVVARDEVYEVAGYSEGRSLRGFTRPVNRVISQLQEEGKLPDDAEELFAPTYNPSIKGFQRAPRFSVAPEIVRFYAGS